MFEHQTIDKPAVAEVILSFLLPPSLSYLAGMQLISLSEVLAHMATGEPCDLRFVTADKARNRGGQILQFEGCRQKVSLTRQESAQPRRPHHYEHATRNIVTKGGRIRKVHIRLITGFNGKKVIY